MTLIIALSSAEEAQLIAKARAQGLAPDVLASKAIRAMLSSHQGPKRPTSSSYGILAKYGPAPSAEEIDENRKEMFRNFAREDEW